MGRRQTFDTEEAVSAATRLFWQGYDATSLADLTGAMGVSSASFYHAFGSKEELFRHVVARYNDALADAFADAFSAPSTRTGVTALLRGYVDVVTDPAHIPGCLVVNNSPSAAAHDGRRRWLAQLRQALRTRLQDQFAADIAAGKLSPHSDPRAMAQYVATLAGGLAVEAQSGTPRQDLYAVIDLALQNFADETNNQASSSTIR